MNIVDRYQLWLKTIVIGGHYRITKDKLAAEGRLSISSSGRYTLHDAIMVNHATGNPYVQAVGFSLESVESMIRTK